MAGRARVHSSSLKVALELCERESLLYGTPSCHMRLLEWLLEIFAVLRHSMVGDARPLVHQPTVLCGHVSSGTMSLHAGIDVSER